MDKRILMTLLILSAFVGSVSAVSTYSGEYDEDSIQPAATGTIAGIFVGIDKQSIVIGGAVALLIVIGMYVALLGKLGDILRGLLGMAKISGKK